MYNDHMVLDGNLAPEPSPEVAQMPKRCVKSRIWVRQAGTGFPACTPAGGVDSGEPSRLIKWIPGKLWRGSCVS